jgi:hypothetical protein
VFASSIAKVQFVADIRNAVLHGELDVSMFEEIGRLGHCWRKDLRAGALDTRVAE